MPHSAARSQTRLRRCRRKAAIAQVAPARAYLVEQGALVPPPMHPGWRRSRRYSGGVSAPGCGRSSGPSAFVTVPPLPTGRSRVTTLRPLGTSPPRRSRPPKRRRPRSGRPPGGASSSAVQRRPDPLGLVASGDHDDNRGASCASSWSPQRTPPPPATEATRHGGHRGPHHRHGVEGPGRRRRRGRKRATPSSSSSR